MSGTPRARTPAQKRYEARYEAISRPHRDLVAVNVTGLLGAIDAARGATPRGRWVREMVEEALHLRK